VWCQSCQNIWTWSSQLPDRIMLGRVHIPAAHPRKCRMPSTACHVRNVARYHTIKLNCLTPGNEVNWQSLIHQLIRRCKITIASNTLDCDQSNYSSRIVFPHTYEFGQTGNSAIRSADPENPILEPNMKWIAIIGRSIAEIWPFEIFPNVRSVAGRSSIYTSSYTDLISSSLR